MRWAGQGSTRAKVKQRSYEVVVDDVIESPRKTQKRETKTKILTWLVDASWLRRRGCSSWAWMMRHANAAAAWSRPGIYRTRLYPIKVG